MRQDSDEWLEEKIDEDLMAWADAEERRIMEYEVLQNVTMPEEILDYLVVHELAHRVEMNHSPAFWAVVAEEIPDYKTRREWLRQNGAKF